MADQPPLPHIQPETTATDGAQRATERAAYLDRLRDHLRDPAFRAIEGFPIGDDQAILALSDPPYYTACPNPFLPEILARWQAERAELRARLNLPDDSQAPGHDNSSDPQSTIPNPQSAICNPQSAIRNPQSPIYHREPFASDVSEGKNDPIYNAHSYHTKVPHKAVMRYILHYTDPGDVVFDGFCGTGMTGVAAQLCGDRKAVEELGYIVDDEGNVYEGKSQIANRKSANQPISNLQSPTSKLGARKAVLVDLSPAATFIAYNYNTPVDVAAFEREAQRILREVEDECGWMYETNHPSPSQGEGPGVRVKGRINYTVWSDVFVCPQCGAEMAFWDVAVDKEAGAVRETFPCSTCGAQHSKRSLERAWETVYDRALSRPLRRAKQIPVLINYSVGRRRCEKAPDADDLALVRRIEDSDIPYWFPADRMPAGDESRRNDDVGLTHVHHFYTRRNLWAFSALWHHAEKDGVLRAALLGGISVGLKMARFRTALWVNKTSGPMKGLTSGTLYVPSLSGEQNWLNILTERVAAVRRQLLAMQSLCSLRLAALTTSSTTELDLPNDCVDYVFTDPPFGGNLMYSELNFISEAWLRVLTNNQTEAIVNGVQCKALPDYQHLMEQCFHECYRVLKPGRWMTVEFHNSQNRVWNAIQEAILRAGFMVADVRTLDKKQGTFKQIASTSAVKQDLVISAYKPNDRLENRFRLQAGTPDGAWAFVRYHLGQLPVAVTLPSPPGRGAGGEGAGGEGGTLEIVAERQPYLLFDRMVAFHVQRGATVPLSAAEFYQGLRERFVERDGMFFLPDQTPAYDRARLEAGRVAQLTLFVSDEKSAIQWLRQQLDPATGGHSHTYQDLQPPFLRQLHQARHEALPELAGMLEQNFLQDEAGRWYVPDPGRAADLERLRRRALLREFAQYVEGRGRLRQFRTEAVRAGFADAWRRGDYPTIVQVAGRLPERVLQEDADLLMYYDNATLRMS